MAPDECEVRDELHAFPVNIGAVEAEEQVHGEYGEESVLGEGRQIIVGVQARILLGVEVVDGGRLNRWLAHQWQSLAMSAL